MKITRQNIVVDTGGGSQKHYPIFTEDDVEYVRLGLTNVFTPVSEVKLKIKRRETVQR